jgi:hypothetical protein
LRFAESSKADAEKILDNYFLKLKKERGWFLFYVFYGRFLTIKTTTAPTIATATIMAAAEARTYVSVFDAGAGVGVAVAVGAFITLNVVSEYDP